VIVDENGTATMTDQLYYVHEWAVREAAKLSCAYHIVRDVCAETACDVIADLHWSIYIKSLGVVQPDVVQCVDNTEQEAPDE